MPLFVLEARQLNSDAPLIATLALALGGLGRFAWPPDGKRRERDLLIALAGLGLGIWAGGFLLGFVLPVLSIVAALIIGHGPAPHRRHRRRRRHRTARRPGHRAGRPAADRSLGASTLSPRVRAFWAFAVLAVVAVVALVIAMTGLTAGKYSLFLGAVPRAAAPTRTFDFLVRQLGFGLFPWSAVAIFALARPLTRLDGEGPATNTRLAFVQLYLLRDRRARVRAVGLPQRRRRRRPLRRAARHRAGAGRVPRRSAGRERRRAGRRPGDGGRDDGRRARLLPGARGARVDPRHREGQVAVSVHGRPAVPGGRADRRGGDLRRAGGAHLARRQDAAAGPERGAPVPPFRSPAA